MIHSVIRSILTLCFLGLFSSIGISQELPFMNWTTADGLAQSQVRSLHKDHLGYLWVGTLGGVSRFNGQEFVSFSRQDGLLGNQVNAITELGDTMLVFGSIGGITTFNGHDFEQFRFPQELKDAQVNHFFSDAQNRLWIATENGSVQWSDSGFVEMDGVGNHFKRHLEWGDEVYAVAKAGILTLGKEKSILVQSKELGATIMDAHVVDDETLLIATIGEGLIVYRRDGWKSFGVEDGLVAPNCTGISEDNLGGYWVKSRDGFSNVLWKDGSIDTISSFSASQGLVNTDVRALMADESGNIWLGTNGGGLFKFINQRIEHYNTNHGIAGDIPMCFAKDQDGSVWIGTYDGGISHWQDDIISNYGLQEGLVSTRIWTGLVDAQNEKWFGTSGGLIQWKEGAMETFTTDDGLPHKQVQSLLDGGDQLWIGTAKGMVRLDKATKELTTFEDLPRTKVRAIQNQESALWLATNTGVYRWEGTELLHLNEANGLPDNSVYCLVVSSQGVVWIGTESGLCRYRAGDIQVLPMEGGFGSNHINFIAESSSGSMWMGTNNGLFFCESPDDALPEFIRIGEHDGFMHLETNQNAVLVDAGKVLVGTSEGMTVLSENDAMLRDGELDTPVHIQNIQVNLDDLAWNDAKFGTKGYGKWPVSIEVPYQQNHFTFYLDAPNLQSASAPQYQYMLQGWEDGWEPVTSNAVANYAKLPFDDYVFRVRTVAPDGSTGPETTVSFSVNAPFWLSWWFILLEVLLVAGVIWWIFRSRRRALIEKLEKEKLEYRSRMLALEQQTLNSSMNRHFIFNALNSIQYYINRKDRLAANRYLSNFAKLIRKNLDSSQVNFTSLREEVERLELYLQLEHMRFKDKFDYEITIDSDVDQESIQVPAMLLQPFLENSIWHGILPKESMGRIDVSIHMHSEDAVQFCITDDGIGIETSRKNKNESGGHISQGMNITSGRIDLLRKMTRKDVRLVGPYEWKDDLGEVAGTKVELILPVDFQSLYAN